MTSHEFKAVLKVNDDQFDLVYQNDEESLWRQVGKVVFEQDFTMPCLITINGENDKQAIVEIYENEETDENKDSKISINLIEDNFYLDKSVYELIYLRHVDNKKNIRTRYDMIPHNMGQRTLSFGAVSGEIGKKGFDKLQNGLVHRKAPSQLFWLRYYQKLKDGFVDYTEELRLEDDEDIVKNYFKEADEMKIEDNDAAILYKMLAEYAKDVLSSSGIEIDFYSNESPYTKRQIKSARKTFNSLAEAANVDDFNALVDKFIAVATPKYQKNLNMNSFYVKEISDSEKQQEMYSEKIEKLESIVLAMEAVESFVQKDRKTDYITPFGNIKIHKETDEEMKETINGLTPKINPLQAKKIVEVYDIKPIEQEKRYEKYLDTLNVRDEMLLFHGSSNGNWLSIIINGLLLNPNAPITGKAYGIGTYFANDSDKSAGYGSSRGSRWANGQSDLGIMGIYKVATGKTYNPGNSIIGGAPQATKDLLKMFKKEGYDSLHYKAGSGSFVRDEIVVYDESASCLTKIFIYEA